MTNDLVEQALIAFKLWVDSIPTAERYHFNEDGAGYKKDEYNFHSHSFIEGYKVGLQAKHSESEPVAKIVKNTGGQITIQKPEGSYFDISKHIGDMLYTKPQASDAEDKLKIAKDALQAECGNRCNAEYNPCAARQALEKIGE